MRNFLPFAFSISRPKFWMYLAGPYIVGYAAGADSFTSFLNLPFALHSLYFLIIANIYVYGLNDLSDTDTDQLNKKKGTKEHLLKSSEKRMMYGLVGFSIAASIGMVIVQPTITGKILFITFLLLSGLYSIPPIRFKARAFFDFASNIHYAIPAFLAYYQLTGSIPTLPIWIASFCWTGAMHVYSAVPDIIPDKKSGVTTTAVFFGSTNSLILCCILWSITAVILMLQTNLFPLSLLAWLYPLYALATLLRPSSIHTIYWYFPYLNTALGAVLFFLALFSI